MFLYTLPIKTKFWDFSNITTQYDKKYSTYNADSIKLNEDKKYKILLSFSCNNEGKVSDIDSSYFIKDLCTDDVKKELYYALLNDKTIQNIEKNTTEKPLD